MDKIFEVFGQESDRERIDMIRLQSEMLPRDMTLWEWVKKIGIDVSEFCRIMKISRSMFYRMIHGGRKPSKRLRAEIIYLSSGRVRHMLKEPALESEKKSEAN